jgi:hypothetical protein
MKTDNLTFMDRCVIGTASMKEYYDYADKWHDTDKSVPIYTYLGLTKEEWDNYCNDHTEFDVLLDALQNRLYLRYITSDD